MTNYPRQYSRNLVRTTSIRIDEELRHDAEKAATFSGMTFGQFCRQALRRNINLYQEIESEVAQRGFAAAAGREK